MDTKNRRLRAFIDTSAILPAFARWRTTQTVPLFLGDDLVERCTFEKCVFECFMVFRGVGGKKPDEGRGDWARRHLRGVDDPNTIEALSNSFHAGDRSNALFWVSNIVGLPSQRELVDMVRESDREKFLTDEDCLDALRRERQKYDDLCDALIKFLEITRVSVVPYAAVFGDLPHPLIRSNDRLSPGWADALAIYARESVIPSEDFEILVTAERVCANIFITRDKRLFRCAWSLSHNRRVQAGHFCLPDDASYSEKLRQYRDGMVFSDWPDDSREDSR